MATRPPFHALAGRRLAALLALALLVPLFGGLVRHAGPGHGLGRTAHAGWRVEASGCPAGAPAHWEAARSIAIERCAACALGAATVAALAPPAADLAVPAIAILDAASAPRLSPRLLPVARRGRAPPLV